MKTIIIMIAYFGRLPEWIDLWMETCKYNSTINWLLVTDDDRPRHRPKNVLYRHISPDAFIKLADSKLGTRLNVTKGIYKMCDFKLAYGKIFEEYIQGYDYFGFGDLDVFYGDLRKFLADQALTSDIITFNRGRLSGHLCLMKNTPSLKSAYCKVIDDWKAEMEDPHFQCITEQNTSVFESLGYSVYCGATHVTPLSIYWPWIDERFSFPSVWYWKEGVVTNNSDGQREFPYLHFMQYKDFYWPRMRKKISDLSPKDMTQGWKVTTEGIFSIDAGDPVHESKHITFNPVTKILIYTNKHGCSVESLFFAKVSILKHMGSTKPVMNILHKISKVWHQLKRMVKELYDLRSAIFDSGNYRFIKTAYRFRRKYPKMLVDIRQIIFMLRALKGKFPCNMLVFGLGWDSLMWSELNKGGHTVFVEDDVKWLETITELHPKIEAYHISYPTKISEWQSLLNRPDRLDVKLDDGVDRTKWDVIFVDGPYGVFKPYTLNNSGS